jgi:hypothetical protein
MHRDALWIVVTQVPASLYGCSGSGDSGTPDNAGGRSSASYSFTRPKIEFGKWNDTIYHTRFSSRSDGLVEVWMNGARVVEYNAAKAFKKGEDLI